MTAITSVDAVAHAYAEAVFRKDVEAFLAIYDPDVVIFDAWDRWIYEGREAWRGMATSWFSDLGEDRVRVSFEPVFSRVDDESATWSAFVRYAAESASGAAPKAVDNRLTWSLARRDGAWRIVHEHTSSPADFVSGVASKQRR